MKKFFIVYKHLTSDFNRTSEIAAMRHYDRTQVASSTILRLGASNLDAASLYIGWMCSGCSAVDPLARGEDYCKPGWRHIGDGAVVISIS